MSHAAENREPEVVLWAEYPGGRDRAAVQSDGRTIYFLVQSDDFPQPKLVWVRNLAPAPLVFSEKDADAGRPPLLPETYCNHPKGLSGIDLEKCRIYWFPQGLGATLFEGDQLLALIPPLPPAELPGFSRDCIHPNAVAIPLEDDDHYLPVTPHLKGYWESWSTPDNYQTWRQSLLQAYQSEWGTPEEVFTTEAESWPPVEVATFQTEDAAYLATIGMGCRAQIGLEKELQNFQDHQQIELAFKLPLSSTSNPNCIGRCVQWLVGLTRYPWFHRTCFLPGHTIEVPTDIQQWFPTETAYLVTAQRPASVQEKMASSEQESASNLVPESKSESESKETRQKSLPRIQLPPFSKQSVNLIWLTCKD